jgi:nucleoside-diphosphate-sugar epimerase
VIPAGSGPAGTSSFCDVRAVAGGMVAAAKNGRVGEGYNLTGRNRSYVDVFTRIAEIVGAKKRPVRVPPAVLGAYGAAAQFAARFTRRPPEMDPGLAKYTLPDDIDQAIRDAAAWYDEFMPVS